MVRGDGRDAGFPYRPDQVAPVDQLTAAALHGIRVQWQAPVGELLGDLLRRQVGEQRAGEQPHDREVLVGGVGSQVREQRALSRRVPRCILRDGTIRQLILVRGHDLPSRLAQGGTVAGPSDSLGRGDTPQSDDDRPIASSCSTFAYRTNRL